MHHECLPWTAIGMRTLDITLLEMERAIKHQQVYGQLPQDMTPAVREILEDSFDPRR